MMNILHASLDISHVNIKVQIPLWAQAWPWMDGMMKDTYYFKNTKARCWLFFKATFIKSLTLLFLLFYCYSMVFLGMLAILQESLQCVCSVLAQFFQSWQDMDLKRLLKICISPGIFSTRKSEFPKVYLNRAFFKHCLMGKSTGSLQLHINFAVFTSKRTTYCYKENKEEMKNNCIAVLNRFILRANIVYIYS